MTDPRVVSTRSALDALARMPVAASLGYYPTPVEPMDRLREALRVPQRLLVKRDDAISFGFGGNKIRKLRYVIPAVLAEGADVVITCGGVQSNHARATAAACAVHGIHCHIVANGEEPAHPSGNALLNRLLGASVEYVSGREGRAPAMAAAAERFRAEGRRPTIVPLGASTPIGALGYVAGVGELLEQGVRPDVIVHAGSSGGTMAGILAGCLLHGLSTRVIAISADDPPAEVERAVRGILHGLGSLLGQDGDGFARLPGVEVDDRFVGDGYGIATPASRAVQSLAARREGFFVDHTYSAKALAGLATYCGAVLDPDGPSLPGSVRIQASATVLFWHTGGQVALFA